MATAKLIYYIRPNRLELFNRLILIVVVCRWLWSWPGQPPQGRIVFWRRVLILFQFDLIKISFLHFHSRLKWPQDRLLNKKLKLSPDILWVDKFSMGSTLTFYMQIIWEDIYHPIFYELMRRWWDENLSLNLEGEIQIYLILDLEEEIEIYLRPHL